MADGDESKHESFLRSGHSRKRSYQNIRNTITGSLKKINKRPKLDGAVGCKSSDNIFKYGNYNRYYGYRNENKEEDKRLAILKKEWFENKSVLDVGSNVGHVSLWIGKNLNPEKVKGVDIDCELVKAARKNIVHYIDENYVASLEQSFGDEDAFEENVKSETKKSVSDEKPCVEDSENLPPIKEILEEVEKHAVPNPDESELVERNAAKSEVVENLTEDCKNNSLASAEEQRERREVIDSEEKCADVLPIAQREDEELENTTCEAANTLPVVQKENEGENSEKIKEEKEYLQRKEHGKVLMERLDRNKVAKKKNVFPYNVTFILENYVPAGSQILQYIKEEFHVILCLSVTKWVQLNFGDFGLKLMFKKMYKQLYPGGKLILEPQPYKSYKRRKNLTPDIRRHYDAMKLMPDQFIEFLLSNEVGFSKSEQIDITPHQKQGFQRPVYVLTKE